MDFIYLHVFVFSRMWISYIFYDFKHSHLDFQNDNDFDDSHVHFYDFDNFIDSHWIPNFFNDFLDSHMNAIGFS